MFGSQARPGLGSLGECTLLGSSLSGDTLGARGYRLEPLGSTDYTLEPLGLVPMLPGFGKRAARAMLNHVRRLPRASRASAMKVALKRMGPTIVNRTAAVTQAAKKRGVAPAPAFEHGLSVALQENVTRPPSGQAALGALALPAEVSTNPNSSVTSMVVCSPDGQFVFVNNAWQRIQAGQVCTSFSATGPTTSTQPGGGVVVATLVCLQPTDQTVVKDGIALAPTEGATIIYQWVCADPTKPGFTRAQQQAFISWIGQSAQPNIMGGGGGLVDLNSVIAGIGHVSPWPDGQFPLRILRNGGPLVRITIDGDDKNIFANVTGDPNNPNIALTWTHAPTFFQSIDQFITEISPWDPSSVLCSLLPVATKVPNPYVAAGSIVLQLSGKCPPQCPTGMLYDAPSKTCSCPPGTAYNAALKACAPVPTDYLPWVIGGGVALVAIALIARRRQQ